ncbi:MAG TPA: hypothetical protein VFU21_14810 [Kofleriaceae bacterium]|nr:hypothetical protein [Kofleriaceae bacterium]
MRSAHLALLLAAAACSQGGSARPTGDDSGGGGPAPADLDPRCAKVQPHVRALYQKARDPSTERDPALADDLLAANVAMVMNDCRADPQRVAPCAERAADAAELERSCLIPLDDEGAVDGDRLIKGT